MAPHDKFQRFLSTPVHFTTRQAAITRCHSEIADRSISQNDLALSGSGDPLRMVYAALNQVANELAEMLGMQLDLAHAYGELGPGGEESKLRDALGTPSLSISKLDLILDLLRKSLTYIQNSRYWQPIIENNLTQSIGTITKLRSTLMGQQGNVVGSDDHNIINVDIDSADKVIATCMIVAHYIGAIVNVV